jgi:hypothetical protein
MPDRDDRIRRRAHEIWEREGRPHGKDAEHWEQAQREVDAEASAEIAAATAGSTRPKSPRAGGKQPGVASGKSGTGKAPSGPARPAKSSAAKPPDR